VEQKVTTAIEQTLNINIESLFNGLSKEGDIYILKST
jgi:hypothetical protein